jgi:hypothetical protein
MSDLELPLTGRDWTVTLPLEQWGNLVVACQQAVEVYRDEHFDAVLQQALAAAVATPPPGYDVHSDDGAETG